VALDFVPEVLEEHSTSIFRIIVSEEGHALTQLIIDPQQGRTRLWTEPRVQMVEELLQYIQFC
jgi:hypothetical protein